MLMAEQPAPVDPRELRVSDAERSHVVNLLQKAIGHGLLSLDEFTERTDVALAAKTRGELNTVLVDLPGLTHKDPTAPAHTPPVELRANMSTINRQGSWRVPRELIIRNRLGSTKLDFSEAEISHAEVRITLDVSGGSVKMLLPAGSSVDTNDVQVVAGSVKDRVGGTNGRPRFIITGRITAGSLKIRRAGYVRIGNLVIRSPWKMGMASD
ncbi:DUF1707 SHOCT-like domain-containing protein [Actinophytocola oryzae]|uniref:Uncharacterized protein DUF1707 n=1 Tax=Actinophytocola oryzae TaxID=502181 RepID=A0A4R7VN76_9PSEU|nr:DUF1707 domain-containing protein [Actinophytocola oryzae]TDV50795.1 uncharacterized protein DUF1707 [Actinophytocola oryzae]